MKKKRRWRKRKRKVKKEGVTCGVPLCSPAGSPRGQRRGLVLRTRRDAAEGLGPFGWSFVPTRGPRLKPPTRLPRTRQRGKQKTPLFRACLVKYRFLYLKVKKKTFKPDLDMMDVFEEITAVVAHWEVKGAVEAPLLLT